MSDSGLPSLSARLSLAAHGQGLSHLIDHSPPTMADALSLAEARSRELRRERWRAEGTAERERIRCWRRRRLTATSAYNQALRDFARRLEPKP